VIFLSGWSGETAQELFALEASHRIESLVLAFEQALLEKERKKPLSEPERDVLAIETLERDVNNGGYSQFFLNSPLEYVSSIVGALQRIGCPRTAAVTERAIAALRLGADLSPVALEERVMNAEPATQNEWLSCDREYLESGEDIAGRLFAYLKQHQVLVSLR
jgi:hypothetical protein